MNKPEIHGLAAEPAHRYSTMAAFFGGGVIRSVNAGRWSCGRRPGARKDHWEWPRRLFSRHARLFTQDDSAGEPQKSAENAKKKDTKQHKQVVTCRSLLAVSTPEVSMPFYVCHALTLCSSSATEPERGRCPSLGLAGWSISEASVFTGFQLGVAEVNFVFPVCERIDSFFAGLAVGLGIGAIAEVAKKTLRPHQQGDETVPALL